MKKKLKFGTNETHQGICILQTRKLISGLIAQIRYDSGENEQHPVKMVRFTCPKLASWCTNVRLCEDINA